MNQSISSMMTLELTKHDSAENSEKRISCILEENEDEEEKELINQTEDNENDISKKTDDSSLAEYEKNNESIESEINDKIDNDVSEK